MSFSFVPSLPSKAIKASQLVSQCLAVSQPRPTSRPSLDSVTPYLYSLFCSLFDKSEYKQRYILRTTNQWYTEANIGPNVVSLILQFCFAFVASLLLVSGFGRQERQMFAIERHNICLYWTRLCAIVLQNHHDFRSDDSRRYQGFFRASSIEVDFILPYRQILAPELFPVTRHLFPAVSPDSLKLLATRFHSLVFLQTISSFGSILCFQSREKQKCLAKVLILSFLFHYYFP